MIEPPEPSGPIPSSTRRRWQFGIGALLLFTTLLSFLLGAFAGIIRARTEETLGSSHFYLILAIAAPLGMLVAVGGCRALVRWLGNRENRGI